MKPIKSSSFLCFRRLLFCSLCFLTLNSPGWASCDGRISDRLANEPEMVAALKRLSTNVTLGDSFRAIPDSNGLVRSLFDRLRFQLYKCNGVCKDERDRYEEIAELKCRFSLLGANFEVPVVKSGWDNPHEYEGKIGSLINLLCEKVAPMAPASGADVFKPRSASEDKALHSCIARYAPLDDVLHATIFSKETPLWLAHVEAWSDCIGKYNNTSDLYHQAAYNQCMLAKDSITKICWDLSSIPLYDMCDPQMPSDEDKLHLENSSGKTTKQLGEGQQRDEAAVRLQVVSVHRKQVDDNARASERGAAKFLDSEDIAPVNEATEAFFSAVEKGDPAGQREALSILRTIQGKYADRCKGRNPHACQASASLSNEVGWLGKE